jgi:hypothetical protein
MVKYSSKKRRFSRLGIAASVLMALIIGLLMLGKSGVINLPFIFKNDDQTKNEDINVINYSPPTEEEKKETEEFKHSQGSNKPNNNPEEPAKTENVAPFITAWGQNLETQDVEVSGYVPGIVESGGICTLSLSKGEQTVTESKAAIADAKNVSCGIIAIEKSRLSTGVWSAVLSYSSDAVTGKSKPVEVTVK